MDGKNEEIAKELAAMVAKMGYPEDQRAAAIAYAILALVEEVRSLGAEVEKHGWAIGDRR